MTVTYRDASVADAAAIAAIGARTFVATFGHLYSAANLAIFLDSHTPAAWARALAGDARVRLAESGGAAVGYARIGPLTFTVDRSGRPGLQLYQLYVDPEWHGRGVAATLLDWAVGAARAQGAADLWLSVFVDNPRARAFYRRRGFVEVMPYTFMVGDHADDDILCRLALDTEDRGAGRAAVPFTTAATLAGTRHGFCGRVGGVSAGIFASLNTGLGSSDAVAAVAENRRRAAAAVAPGAALVTVHQIHSATVVVADSGMADGADPAPVRVPADGVVTNRRGLVLGILAADCAPVLFADVRAGVVGAAHAGWKGALYGVLPATVAAMERLGARREDIAAAVGPCIAQGSYEVQDAYADPFLAADPAFARFFRAGRTGHRHFDLEGFVAAQLAAAGVTRVECLDRDTYTGGYFSYRRSVHAREPDYGRNLSLIALA